MLNSVQFVQLLANDAVIGRSRIVNVASCDSTMLLAKAALSSATRGAAVPTSALHGALFVADEQTAGRGRRGRSWLSRSGNLLFTFAWVHAPGSDVFNAASRLNFATPLAVVDQLRAIGVASASTKWPNDCLVDGRKICGILVDNECDVTYVGVGVNLRDDFGGDVVLERSATSVARELSATAAAASSGFVARESFLAGVLARIDAAMRRESLAQILARYDEAHALRGAVVRVHHRSRDERDPADYDAAVCGISPFGLLRVQRLDASAAVVELSGEASDAVNAFERDSDLNLILRCLNFHRK